jgi:hypothetical protein
VGKELAVMEIADRVIDAVKGLRDIARKIENAELQNRIGDLMNASADIKMEMAELKSENIRLRDENAMLKRKRELRAGMRVEEGVLFPLVPIPGYGDGPFCPLCLEKDGLLLHVLKYDRTKRWYCPHCEKHH